MTSISSANNILILCSREMKVSRGVSVDIHHALNRQIIHAKNVAHNSYLSSCDWLLDTYIQMKRFTDCNFGEYLVKLIC